MVARKTTRKPAVEKPSQAEMDAKVAEVRDSWSGVVAELRTAHESELGRLKDDLSSMERRLRDAVQNVASPPSFIDGTIDGLVRAQYISPEKGSGVDSSEQDQPAQANPVPAPEPAYTTKWCPMVAVGSNLGNRHLFHEFVRSPPWWSRCIGLECAMWRSSPDAPSVPGRCGLAK